VAGGEGQPDGGGTGEDQGGQSGESRNKTKPKDLNALAERLGIQVSELYDIVIPAPGGREPMKLGQLKDRYESWNALEADRLAFSETKVAQEAELQRARDEVRELLSIIPRQHLTQEMLQRAGQRVAARNQALDAKLLEVVPEWKDAERRSADTKALAEMLAGYGFNEHEVKAIRDPRLVKFMRDAQRRAEQVRKALEAVKKQPTKPTTPNVARGAPRRPASPDARSPLRPQSGRERFSELLRQET